MKNNLKSALAFFFLFFLHGFSIRNGQQGISYNVSGISDVADFKHHSRYEEPQLVKVKMFNRFCFIEHFCVYLQNESIRLYSYKIRY